MKTIYIIYFFAMQLDALQQAIQHLGLYRIRIWDFAWHIIYWFFTIPAFALWGYYLIIWLDHNWQWFYDFWHYQLGHFIFVGHLICGVIGWQISYRLLWKKILNPSRRKND